MTTTASLKTVESHLNSINRKADVSARGQVILLFATGWTPVQHYLPPGDDVSAGCF